MVFDDQTEQRLVQSGVIAVLVLDRAEDAVPVAEALLAGGVRGMELTLRTDAALDALAEIKQHVPEMLAGMGTVLTVEQIEQVRHLGADFAVAPGVNPRVIQAAIEHDLPFAPGVMTPTDIEQALQCGCRLLKFFPAELTGGLPYLRSVAAPYAHLGVRFIPLGGVNTSNLVTYLADPLIAAVGGSWLALREVIRTQQWQAITNQARQAAERVARVPSETA